MFQIKFLWMTDAAMMVFLWKVLCVLSEEASESLNAHFVVY